MAVTLRAWTHAHVRTSACSPVLTCPVSWFICALLSSNIVVWRASRVSSEMRLANSDIRMLIACAFDENSCFVPSVAGADGGSGAEVLAPCPAQAVSMQSASINRRADCQ